MRKLLNSLNYEKESKGLDYSFHLGDLVHGEPELLSILKKEYFDKLNHDYYVAFGNHDHATEDVWVNLWGYGYNHRFVKDETFAFILLNTSNADGDYLCPEYDYLYKSLELFKDYEFVILLSHIAWHGDKDFDEHGINCVEIQNLVDLHNKKYNNIVVALNGHHNRRDNCYLRDGIFYHCYVGNAGGTWGVEPGYRIFEINDKSVNTYYIRYPKFLDK